MGGIVSKITRPLRLYNIENRAHKVLDREKPKPAPLYDISLKQLEVAKSKDPNFMEEHSKKDKELDERLKNIFVISRDPQTPAVVKESYDRPLPKLTRSGEDQPYGFYEPEKSPPLKCSLRTILSFLLQHLENPIQHSATTIALKHNLDIKDVENILKYYSVFSARNVKDLQQPQIEDESKIQIGESDKPKDS